MFAEISITTIIGLIIFVAVAIISSLVKKKEEEPFELPPELKPRGDRPKPPVRSWEEELRRVLEQSASAPPAPPPIVQHAPAPPNVLRVPPPAPAGVPPPAPLRGPPVAPRLVPPPRPIEHGWDEGRIEVTLPIPEPHITPTFHAPKGLVESDQRYAHASQLQERVAAHMGDVTRHRVGTTLVQRTAATIEATDATQTIRTRRGIRNAIIASIILGPPRALEG